MRPTAVHRLTLGQVVEAANAASDEVLIAGGPLPQEAKGRQRHFAGLVPLRVATAAAIVRGANPLHSESGLGRLLITTI